MAARTWYPLTGKTQPEGRGAAVAAAAAKPVIDPLTGPKLALAGRVVTMDDAFSVLEDGVVYIDKGSIVAVRDVDQLAPDGFAGVAVVDTGGTLFPGLIELHNHLSYNALPLWPKVPKRFEHRGQWPDHKDYRPLVSGPMTIVGQYRDAAGKSPLLAPLVRYVECKCLLGGVTTSQGVRLSSNAGIQRFYRGIVRNVEQTDEIQLPEAQGRIPDIDAKDARSFQARLDREDSCFLLHLSEGRTDPAQPDSVARRHFLALEIGPGKWALNDRFTAIHATGLLPEDFEILRTRGSSIVWSPLSNLLLYGDTTRVRAAKEAEVKIGLGSDWSPTGSKNLLGELKVAWLYNQHVLRGLFAARDIVAMATRSAARILKWNAVLGTLEKSRRADLLVVKGAGGDPYDALLHASEADITLVMINGVARYGTDALMSCLAPKDQTVKVGGETRRLFLEQATSDPDVAKVSLRTATSTLRKALKDIAKLAKEVEQPKAAVRAALGQAQEPVWSLALDEIQPTGAAFRPHLPYGGPRDFTGPTVVSRAAAAAAAAKPLSAILGPIDLDPLTVVDDADFLTLVEAQANVHEPIRKGLRTLY